MWNKQTTWQDDPLITSSLFLSSTSTSLVEREHKGHLQSKPKPCTRHSNWYHDLKLSLLLFNLLFVIVNIINSPLSIAFSSVSWLQSLLLMASWWSDFPWSTQWAFMTRPYIFISILLRSHHSSLWSKSFTYKKWWPQLLEECLQQLSSTRLLLLPERR